MKKPQIGLPLPCLDSWWFCDWLVAMPVPPPAATGRAEEHRSEVLGPGQWSMIWINCLRPHAHICPSLYPAGVPCIYQQLSNQGHTNTLNICNYLVFLTLLMIPSCYIWLMIMYVCTFLCSLCIWSWLGDDPSLLYLDGDHMCAN
jgi:hypothetical protein